MGFRQNWSEKSCCNPKWTIGTISYQLVPANFWTHQLTVWLRKLLNKTFRWYYIALHAFSRNIDFMSPKSRKRDQKPKKLSADADFPFWFVATLSSHWYQDGIKILAQSPEPVWLLKSFDRYFFYRYANSKIATSLKNFFKRLIF